MAISAVKNTKFCNTQNFCTSPNSVLHGLIWHLILPYSFSANSILSVPSLVYSLFSAFPNSCMFCTFCVKQSVKLSCSASSCSENIQYSAFQHLNSAFRHTRSSFKCWNLFIILLSIKNIEGCTKYWMTENWYRSVCDHLALFLHHSSH